jgi:hypothetical protein
MALSSQFDDYRIFHQPDTSDDELRFHELDKAMPDFYERPDLYMWDMKEHREALRQANTAKGNPDADIRIYRAVPHGVATINPGDWVTTSRNYAIQHGKHPEDPSKDKPVISGVTKARHITFGGSDGIEFGYAGTEQLPNFE